MKKSHEEKTYTRSDRRRPFDIDVYPNIEGLGSGVELHWARAGYTHWEGVFTRDTEPGKAELWFFAVVYAVGNPDKPGGRVLLTPAGRPYIEIPDDLMNSYQRGMTVLRRLPRQDQER